MKKGIMRDIVNKCKDELKLFFRYVNGKMKNKQTIDKLMKDDITYKDTRLQAELMNKCFQSVFTKESKFK